MTNINSITETQIATTQLKPKAKKQGGFENNLKDAIEKQQESEPQKANSKYLNEIQSVMLNPIEEVSVSVKNKTASLLNLLDNYASSLKDPHRSLKQIEPLITEINDKAQNLYQEANTKLNDIDLKQIANQAAMAANVEFFKFQRGDYI